MLAGIIIGILGTLYIWSDMPYKIDPSQVRVDNVSGSKLSVIDVIKSKTSTVIDTKYEGAGESKITIKNIYYRYSICGFVSTDKSVYLGGGYNWGRFKAFGGVWFRNNNNYSCGLWIGGMYQF